MKKILLFMLLSLISLSACANRNKANIGAAYDAIKANFKTAVDNHGGILTWKDWDRFKGPLYAKLSDTNLNTNQMWDEIKKDFGIATRDNAWSVWDIITGKAKAYGQLNDFHTILTRLSASAGSGSAGAAAAGRLAHYLYDRNAIKAAVASPTQGKGMVIPYFGYWNAADIKAYNKAANNGFWYLSNYFVSDPKINWTLSVSLTFRGQTYHFNTVEAAFQAGKCLVSGYISTPTQINEFVSATPDQSKYLANTKYKYQYKPSDAAKIDALMTSLVRQKFINGPLGKKLVKETGETTLIEGNSWDDAVWGEPFDGVKHVPATKGFLAGQKPLGKLGKMLMQIRGELKNGTAKNEPAFSI